LMEAGLDSLGAAELRTSIARHVGVAPVELVPTLIFDYPTVSALAKYLAIEHVVPASSPAFRRKTRLNPSRSTAMVSMVRNVVTGMLGTVIPVDAHLMDAGLDYVGAVKLGKLLEQAAEVKLPDTLVFEHPSIAALASYLQTRLNERERDTLMDDNRDHGSSASGTSSVVTAEPTDTLHSQLVELVTSLLGIQVDPQDPLMDIGLGSLGAAELRTSIAGHMGMEPAELIPNLLFYYPSICSLVGYLSTQLVPAAPHTTGKDPPGPGTSLTTTQQPAMLAMVRGMVAGLLGTLVPVEQHLLDAGLDFLGAVKLGELISKAVETDLPHTIVFEYPSVRALATYLETEVGVATFRVADAYADPGSEFGSCCSDELGSEHALSEGLDSRPHVAFPESQTGFQRMLQQVLMDELPSEVKESDAIDVQHLVDGLVESFGFIEPMLVGVPTEDHADFTRRVVAAMLPVAGTVFIRLRTLGSPY